MLVDCGGWGPSCSGGMSVSIFKARTEPRDRFYSSFICLFRELEGVYAETRPKKTKGTMKKRLTIHRSVDVLMSSFIVQRYFLNVFVVENLQTAL